MGQARGHMERPPWDQLSQPRCSLPEREVGEKEGRKGKQGRKEREWGQGKGGKKGSGQRKVEKKKLGKGKWGERKKSGKGKQQEKKGNEESEAGEKEVGKGKQRKRKGNQEREGWGKKRTEMEVKEKERKWEKQNGETEMRKRERKWGKMKENGEMGTAPAPSSPVLRGRLDGICKARLHPGNRTKIFHVQAEAAGGAGLSKTHTRVGFGSCCAPRAVSGLPQPHISRHGEQEPSAAAPAGMQQLERRGIAASQGGGQRAGKRSFQGFLLERKAPQHLLRTSESHS